MNNKILFILGFEKHGKFLHKANSKLALIICNFLIKRNKARRIYDNIYYFTNLTHKYNERKNSTCWCRRQWQGLLA